MHLYRRVPEQLRKIHHIHAAYAKAKHAEKTLHRNLSYWTLSQPAKNPVAKTVRIFFY